MGVFDPYPVTGAEIREAAESSNSSVTALEELEGDVRTTHRPAVDAAEGDIEPHIGSAADQPNQQNQAVRQKVTFAKGALIMFANAVDDYNTDSGPAYNVTGTQANPRSVSKLNQYYSERQGANFGLNEDDYEEGGSKENGDFGADKEAAAASLKSELQTEYGWLGGNLDDGAEEVAGLLTGPITEDKVRQMYAAGGLPSNAATIWPNVNFSGIEFEELPSDLAAMTPEELAQYVRDHEDIDPSLIPLIPAATQTILATDVADEIQGKNIDSQTVRLTGLFKDQQPFAHALYSDVTPNELGDAILHLNNEAFDTTLYTTDEDARELYSVFLKNAGHTFATYTKGEGEYAPPSNLSETWFNAITDDENHENAAALTLLLRKGGGETSYETDFMTDLSERIYDWERDHDGDPVWSPREDYVGPLNDLILDPDAVKIEDRGNGVTLYSGGGYATDGLANILGAMENSPEAAQNFFTNDDGEIDSDRLDYLIGKLDGDDVDARTFALSDRSDEGEGLAKALQAATIGDRDHELIPGTNVYRDELSASLASDVFTRIGELSAADTDGFGPDDQWHIWSKMGDELGAIASGYSSDVYDIIDGAPQSGPTHLNVSLENFDEVLGEIGRGDKTGIETLSAAIMIEGNERINDSIEQWVAEHPGEPLTMDALADSGLGLALQGRGATNGEILGHILNKSVLVDLEDKELAETRAAYISKAIDIAGGFIPGAGSVLGEGASELAKSAFDLTKSEGINALKSAVEGSPDATADEYRQQSRDTTETALEYNILNQLIRNGYLGDQNPGEEGADHTPAIPESLLVDGPNGTQVVNPDLYDADGVDQIGEDGEYTAAQIQQMREDWNRWMNSQPRNIAEGITSQAQDGFDREVNNGP